MQGYNEDFRCEDGVLHARLTGTFPNELLYKGGNLFQPLIDACSAQNYKQVLIDARDLQVDFNTTALFQAGKDAAPLARIGIRIALLARQDMIDPFFDYVVSNLTAMLGYSRRWILPVIGFRVAARGM